MASTQKSPWILTNEMRGEVVELLEKVRQSGKWPQQACTRMFFLIPKNVTSERPIALMTTLIRWWEALRAPEVAKWQQKYRVDWDAADGRNGGAQQTVWEILMEMERFKYRAGEKTWEQWPWCWTWRRHSRESVCLVVWAWATHFSFLKEDVAGVVASSTRGEYSFEGCLAEPVRAITAI